MIRQPASSKNSLNLFTTERPPKPSKANKNTNNSVSHEKYSKNFCSNIFFTENIKKIESKQKEYEQKKNELKVAKEAKREIKVNRITDKKAGYNFEPKFKDNDVNSLQRKIHQLKGSSSGLLSSFGKKGNSMDFSSKSRIQTEDAPGTSIGYYDREQLVKTNLKDCESAKERYYMSLSNNRVGRGSKEDSNPKARCNSMRSIKFTNDKVTQCDNTKVEFNNDSRKYLYDNLYSNKIFPNKSMVDLTKKTSSAPKFQPAKNKKAKPNLFTSLNWEDKKPTEEYNPKKVKFHSNFESLSDWKEINTELALVKKYNTKEKFAPKDFGQKLLKSSINGAADPLDVEIMRSREQKRDNLYSQGFNKLKNKSQEKLLNSKTENKLYKTEFADAKSRKAYDLQTSNIFATETSNRRASMGELNTNSVPTTDYYEINLKKEMPSNDVKKLLIKNGLHVYNVKEQSKWTNGNGKTKLVFQIRNINGKDKGEKLSSFQEKLKEQGLKIQETQEQSPILEKKPDMFPVQAKWNDYNIRNYHITMENNKKPQKTDNNIKKTLPYDKNLLMYKNDKMHCNRAKKRNHP
mmetsp:Transcript_34730/g.36093  ORF Transcript_34730/g.36093 Transcript_34730/m.36093 type:complete len:575 (+) Transcript_34730:12-1736(+)